jgi:hypothetical protein
MLATPRGVAALARVGPSQLEFFFCKGEELHSGDSGMRGHGDTFGSENLDREWQLKDWSSGVPPA